MPLSKSVLKNRKDNAVWLVGDVTMGPDGGGYISTLPEKSSKYKTTRASIGGRGTASSPDLVTRYRYRVTGTTGPHNIQSYVSPRLVYEETFKDLLSHGLSPTEAGDRALSKASSIADQFTHNRKLGTQARLELQELKMATINDPYAGMEIPTGSYQGDRVRRGPRGTKVSGTGHNPNSAKGSLTSQNQVSEGQLETFEFVSVDGEVYSFPKKIGNEPVRGFFNRLFLIAMAEMAKGGNPFTPIAAAGIAVEDGEGKTFFDFTTLLTGGEMEEGENPDDDVPSGVSM